MEGHHTKMTAPTNEQLDRMRRRCAEIRGWTFQPMSGPLYAPWVAPDKKWETRRSHPPDYPRSLDAMHEAEASLKPVQVCEYRDQLERITDGTEWGCVHATAAERCLAFIFTHDPEYKL